MINTPIGRRFLMGRERAIFIHAAKRFAEWIQGLDKRPCNAQLVMLGGSEFHNLTPQEQLVILHASCHALVSKSTMGCDWSPRLENMSRLENVALDAVYCWLLYEINLEISGVLEQKLLRNGAYGAWCDLSGFTFDWNDAKPDMWTSVVRYLAQRVVHVDHGCLVNKSINSYKFIGDFLSAKSYFTYIMP